jgi:DNA-binding beta-propeller fold protein YncE
MIHTLKCPSCAAPVEFDDHNHSPTFRCQFCNNTVAVPESMRPRRDPQVVVSTFSSRPQSTVKVGRGTGLLIIIVFLLSIVGVFVYGIVRVVSDTASSLADSRKPPAPPVINVPQIPRGLIGEAPGPSAPASVVLKFGSEGTGPGYFTDARSIAVDGDGRIYVGEYTGGRIQVFDASGKFLTQWMADTEMPLRAIAADRRGTVYVVQRGEIKKFEGPTGKALGKVAFSSNGFDDVVALPDGGLLAAWVRASSDDIVRFDPSGRVTLSLTKAISGQTRRSELDVRLAADGAGNIYALGTFNDAVFKFSPDGRFQTRFGSAGDKPGQFRAPDAIAVDNQGRVYVSDFKGIQRFEPDGRHLDTFKVEGSASGMVFNDRNELFIVARTQVLKYALK